MSLKLNEERLINFLSSLYELEDDPLDKVEEVKNWYTILEEEVKNWYTILEEELKNSEQK